MSFKSSSLLCIALFLAWSSAISGFNINELLQKEADLSTFNKYITEAKLADEINSRNTITVLAVNNEAIASIAGKSPEFIKAVISTHVILDFFDEKKLMEAQATSQKLTTLYQASGLALKEQGFISVQLIGEGAIAFNSVGSSENSELVRTVLSQPYNISILQVTKPIIPLGLDSQTPTAQSPQGSQSSPQTAKAPSATDTAQSPATTKTADAPAPAQSAQAPATTKTSDAPAPAQSAQAPATTTTTDAPAPTQTAKAPASTKTGDAPAPAENAKAPASAKTGDAPAPAQSAKAPAPAKTADAPAPAKTADAPAPAKTADAPAPTKTTDAPTPSAASPPATATSPVAADAPAAADGPAADGPAADGGAASSSSTIKMGLFGAVMAFASLFIVL
ncbi:unnamed protein product [Sphenostylis stenocarpa]|uniref:FAS1 domain-containing protein n=1 Tax=Sphenostylis stenocarpa TaxID=92480 RepID=A0AA86VNX7_9FABA|nr:unnamed protein product [Sphenostylis stenocarpa]